MASKRKAITLETKYQIVTAVDANKQYKKQIADEFGISPSTLSTILKSKDKILEAYQSNDFDSARKKLCTADYKDVENVLFEWFKSVRDENIPLSGPMLAIKANELAKKLGHADFSASQSWVERFKHRRGIVCRTVCGESESVNSNVLDDYVTKLPSLLIGYQPRDIFNIDETGLFYKLLPNKTLALKGEECHGGKHSKERITLLVGSNMDGSEKLKLLVIGKAKQPRCFKGVKALPVDYEGNTKAWMTGDIFKDWVITFDRKMQRQKRKVLLFVDNCPAHPHIDNLQATTMVFLPPNTTSKLQPMDQGIIKCLKQHSRRQLIQYMLNCFKRKQDTAINLHHGITFAHSAWHKVSSKCISACFRKAGFVISEQTTDSDLVNYPPHHPPHLSGEEDDEEEEDNLPLSALKSMWLEVQSKLQMSENINLDDYVDVDTEVVIAKKPTDDDIVASVQQKHSGQPEED
ncbi:tigger transposable element-derived protein 4-like [Latimeria chalumnae]|uniref:tigger transposable element-derived protein 4-like n=1 Tax=Latimeria chalumnae TaxID=7897 RepID=UPI00313CE993